MYLKPILLDQVRSEEDYTVRVVFLEELPENVLGEFLRRIQARFSEKLSRIELTDMVILHFKNHRIVEEVIEELDTFVSNIIPTIRRELIPVAA